jgi:hypothetical protein
VQQSVESNENSSAETATKEHHIQYDKREIRLDQMHAMLRLHLTEHIQFYKSAIDSAQKVRITSKHFDFLPCQINFHQIFPPNATNRIEILIV